MLTMGVGLVLRTRSQAGPSRVDDLLVSSRSPKVAELQRTVVHSILGVPADVVDYMRLCGRSLEAWRCVRRIELAPQNKRYYFAEQ